MHFFCKGALKIWSLKRSLQARNDKKSARKFTRKTANEIAFGKVYSKKA